MMVGNRQYRLDQALSRVRSKMELRRPQRESLEKVHQIVTHLDRDLGDLTQRELLDKVLDFRPDYCLDIGHPKFTFALATGVGKTRLMGALMAYLYRGGQSENFLIVVPRTAILRKILAECVEGSDKYIFVDPALIPEPRLWQSGNLAAFTPDAACNHIDRRPNVFVFSPQSITGGDRHFSRASEFAGISMLDFLKSLPDLVVFVDEAHHLRTSTETEIRAWTDAVDSLEPKLQFGMTATPRLGVPTLHTYDLATALREKMYTKNVRVVVQERTTGDGVSDDEWDHVTLNFALDRLARKERAIEEYQEENQFPTIRPVLMICAEDTAHADEVEQWLITEKGIPAEEILTVHSHRRSEETIERLIGIENPESKVRVVVNVYQLTEGWDVTNVYVIAPLRRMGTFQGAVQTMGRGLRLPAGRRVDDEELDSLDVLCFGRESLQGILHEALRAFGGADEADPAVTISSSIAPDLNRDLPSKVVRIQASRGSVSLHLPEVVREPVEPDLDFDIGSVRQLLEQTAREFDLVEALVSASAEAITYKFDEFSRLVTSKVLADLKFLSEPLHRGQVQRLVSQLLVGRGYGEESTLSLDWVFVAEIVKEQIRRPYEAKPAAFRVSESYRDIEFGPFDWKVPETFKTLVDHLDLADWSPTLSRVPIGGWRRSVCDGVPFDRSGEYRTALLLDSSAGVNWWARNDPPRLKLSTPAGNYQPDFVVTTETSAGRPRVVIIEVKGDVFWLPEDSEPRIKSRAADAWCDAVNSSCSDVEWAHWLVLHTDVDRAMDLTDLEKLRANPGD